ncbi:hypothetical protein J4E08_07110 [Sagittula sp. NFXS13]|uniref:hypothetical protein n=1 Tax=Sagittula sp. NFXS13 TaxID=2819095 RepID=UPI0032DEB4CC
MARSVLALVLILFALVMGGGLPAQTISMESRGALISARGPLIGGGATAIISSSNGGASVIEASVDPNGAQASLFAGRAAASLFAPWPVRKTDRDGVQGILPVRSGSGPVARLRDLIAAAEAGSAQYDAVQYGARIKTPKPPTQMTLGEIFAWIDATPGQPHAIGRYQIIPKTLRGLVRKAHLGPTTRFSPQVQDALADILLEEAGLSAMQDGVMTRRAFMNNVAKIWAGLPNASGRSHYHGYAGNKATMSWAHYEAQMRQIFPSAT